MRRTTKRALLHLTLFGVALFLIVFLNRPQSNKDFAWNEIRYKTSSSTTLPKARGVCPGLARSSKPALVVARVVADGDSSWLNALANLYHLCVYTADAPADTNSMHLQVPANRGHEAMAYLTFLIDNYAHIPAAGVVFVHGSRWAWHNDAPDYDNAALLAALNISAALAPWGYHNLRCDWSLSTCPLSLPPQGSLETTVQAVMAPWDARAVSDAALPAALAALFGGNAYAVAESGGRLLLGRSDAVRAQCCAQFVVARDRIWQHSRDEYVALRQWLLDGSDSSGTDENFQNSNAAPGDDRVAGRILSYVWHILFTKQDESNDQTSSPEVYRSVNLERLNTLACPRADECYCRLYGRCNLEHCTSPGSCYGQYVLPPDLKLPDEWAATHTKAT
ncbi:MAG: hypothetical protein M1818_003642 [Claussenomyces sp. TS43310]|nr:MAG: hypothetical protein M1818_003642 [Claussenomyces sp. TS43310]